MRPDRICRGAGNYSSYLGTSSALCLGLAGIEQIICAVTRSGSARRHHENIRRYAPRSRLARWSGSHSQEIDDFVFKVSGLVRGEYRVTSLAVGMVWLPLDR